MNPQETIDLSREAITMAASIAGPMLIAGLVIGLIVGVLQAMTQIQDQTVSAVPKIVGMMLVGLLALPWISDRMVDYTRDTLSRPLVGGRMRSNTPANDSFQSNSATLDQSDSTVRVAALPAFAPVFPTAPKLLPASTSMPAASIPSMKFNSSSMPQMRLPQQRDAGAPKSTFQLPSFKTMNGQQDQAKLNQTSNGG